MAENPETHSHSRGRAVKYIKIDPKLARWAQAREDVRGIRRGGSTFRLERVGHVRALAGRAQYSRGAAANDYEIASR